MKIFKTILLLSIASLMTACGSNTTERLKGCLEQVPANEQVGVATALQLVEEYTEIFFGKITKQTTTPISSCMISCKEGFTYTDLKVSQYKTENPSLISLLSNDKDRAVCVPSKRPCLPSGFANLLGLNLSNVFSSNEDDEMIGQLSGIDAANYSACEEEEGPVVCLAEYVLNSETNSCVPEELSCTEEELAGIGAATGYRQFNTMTNEYDLCQAITCLPDYTLGLGICNPDDVGGGGDSPVCTPPQQLDIPTNTCQIFGCMDNRADNYNSEATMSDMSCMCSGPLPYNPITGCDSGPVFPPPMFP